MIYIKDNKIVTTPCNGVNITLNGGTIMNPTEEQLIEAGYVEFTFSDVDIKIPEDLVTEADKDEALTILGIEL